ncbi:Inhibitor of growth protein 1 [Sciurus carolinensis]|uniref:Inhibitor of growth protein 1 n=1 Tax=Sciurus carolinensis TaxID=30640 RepID=A0AA41SYB6_SCICA|nr:Inhibitor of growth protein 1 [Sciurus carolinensis]
MVELVEIQNRQMDSHVELFEVPQEIKDTTGNSCKAGQEKAKNETVAQAEKLNYKLTLQLLNNVNQVMNVSNNNHDHDDITSGTPKEKIAKTSKRKQSKDLEEEKALHRLHGQNREESKTCQTLQWFK